jgi:agmatinase
MLAASHQLDFFDVDYGVPVREGIAWEHLEHAFPCENPSQVLEANVIGERINTAVYDCAAKNIATQKVVGIVGGEHSVPFGLIKALGEQNSDFGILHIDAHHDLRNAYEGYEHSHASIMFNVLRDVPQARRLTSVGIRDFSKTEYDFAKDSNGRVVTFYDRDLQEHKAEGRSWRTLVKEIVATLPKKVYISVDIDGLDPSLCPSTGTPVPGGLLFAEVDILLRELMKQSKQVIGFDLCEVAPGEDSEWDANVGARILYKLCGLALATRPK